MYQTPTYNYMPMNFLYFVPSPPNFDKDLTSETYVPTNDLLEAKSSQDESIRAEKKKQKALCSHFVEMIVFEEYSTVTARGKDLDVSNDAALSIALTRENCMLYVATNNSD